MHSQRYYLAPVEGSGTPGDPYYTKIMKYPVACATTIPIDGDGRLLDEVALCLVSGDDEDHASLFADRDMVPCADRADAMVKAIEFGKQIRESRRALAAMRLLTVPDLKLAKEQRAERAYKEAR